MAERNFNQTSVSLRLNRTFATCACRGIVRCLKSSCLNVGVVLVEISMVWTRLCAAQLMSCDVIMPDEPSGCMDVDNIGLLEDRKGSQGHPYHVRGDVPGDEKH